MLLGSAACAETESPVAEAEAASSETLSKHQVKMAGMIARVSFALRLESLHKPVTAAQSGCWVFQPPVSHERPISEAFLGRDRSLLRGQSVDESKLTDEILPVEKSISHSPHTPRRKERASLLRAKSVGYSTIATAESTDEKCVLTKSSLALRQALGRSLRILPQVWKRVVCLPFHDVAS